MTKQDISVLPVAQDQQTGERNIPHEVSDRPSAALPNGAQVLTTDKDSKPLLESIAKQAVRLLGAKDGGISRFDPERGEFIVIADNDFPEAIGTAIKMDEGLAGLVLKDDLPFLATTDYNSYPHRAQAHAKTARFGAVLMVNLKWQNRTVGVLYINDEQGRDFQEPFPPLLKLLASAAAIAIANAHLLYEAEVFRSSYEASTALASHVDSARVLQDLTFQVLEAAEAQWVRLIVIDEGGGRRNFLASHGNQLVKAADRIRPAGISMQVLETGVPRLIEDVDEQRELLNQAMIDDGSRAAMCLPLWLGLKRLGIIWIHYTEPRRFSKSEVAALMLFLRQAAVAYDAARQKEELEPLRLVIERLGGAANTEEVYKLIVSSARNFLGADFAAIWPYPDDESLRELPVRDAVTDGIGEELLNELRDAALPVGEITSRVLKDGWYGISDIEQPSEAPLPSQSRRLLNQLGARAFQGLGLAVPGERVGVLYLVYRSPHRFHQEDTHRARTFATYAAQALKAGLVEHVTKAQIAAHQVAKLTTLGDWMKTLRTVVRSTKDVLGCDAVTLFIYNAVKERIEPFTTMVGVNYKRNARHCEDAPPDSIVYKMIKRNRSYCVPRVEDDPLFGQQRFVKREGIRSVCAIPLKVKDQRVGVMFVNYRNHHNFTKPELATVQLFANQAAVAIRNSNLYREQKKRLSEQQLVATLSKQLLAASSLKDALSIAVHTAAHSLKTDYAAIVMQDGDGRFRIKAKVGWNPANAKAYEHDYDAKYQMGYTIRTRKPVRVDDYSVEKRFRVPGFLNSKGVKSGLSVPILIGNKAAGAMLTHSDRRHAFAQEDTRILSLIANLTAIAIQHHRAVDSKIASMAAVQRASDEISRINLGAGQREVLDKIVEQTVRCLPQAFLGTIQLYDETDRVLIFESVYSETVDQKERARLASLVGDKRPLVRQPGKPIGIAGRAVLEKRAQRVDDIRHDPDYYDYYEHTRSELAVPLLTEDYRVRGVLNVESMSPAAFGKDDEETLGALAKLAVTTLENVETRKLVASSALLAWLGMASSDWGHSVAANAFNIRDNVDLLREELDNHRIEPTLRALLDDRLDLIQDLAAQIYQKPIAALLSFDKGVSTVSINNLIRERVEQIWQYGRYKVIPRELSLSEKEPLVRCSPEWIKRLLEILIDNAVDAMDGMPDPTLTISTSVVDNQVEIAVRDTGPGIPPEIRDKLFRQRIDKRFDSKGLGVGLLMVEAIAQIYRGRAGVSETGPHGTTMYVRLPVARDGSTARRSRRGGRRAGRRLTEA